MRSFQFNKNSANLLVNTKDLRIKFYGLDTFEGTFLRELTCCHRGAILSLDLSENGGYFLTGGEDNLIKVWDFEAQKTTPYFYQAYIGHTYAVSQVMFDPRNNNRIFSMSHDGLFVWDFRGDCQTQYLSEPLYRDRELKPLNRSKLHEPTVLERMRNAVKNKIKKKLDDFCFVMPEFVEYNPEERSKLMLMYAGPKEEAVQREYCRIVDEDKLCVNHYVSLQKYYEKGNGLVLDKPESGPLLGYPQDKD